MSFIGLSESDISHLPIPQLKQTIRRCKIKNLTAEERNLYEERISTDQEYKEGRDLEEDKDDEDESYVYGHDDSDENTLSHAEADETTEEHGYGEEKTSLHATKENSIEEDISSVRKPSLEMQIHSGYTFCLEMALSLLINIHPYITTQSVETRIYKYDDSVFQKQWLDYVQKTRNLWIKYVE
jgi:hypothetical protein